MDEIKTPETPMPAGSETPEPTSGASGGGAGLLVKALLVLVILIAGGAGAAAYYYYSQVQQLQSVDPQEAAQAEVQQLINRVSELIVLPSDEQPTVATVAEPERLQDQPFFKNAHKGDRVLIYTNARKAYLYDPVAHKIIEVAPVSIGADTAGAQTPPLPEGTEEVPQAPEEPQS